MNLKSSIAPLFALSLLGILFLFFRWQLMGLTIAQFSSLEHLPKLKSSLTFGFLGWNLFLAWLPLLFAIWFAHCIKQGKALWISGSIFLLWLLFLPNAPYILTDLLHLKWRHPVPHWFDLMTFVLFAWTGWHLGIQSLMLIYRSISGISSSRTAMWVVGIAIFLCGPGVYLGRVLRYNSWDIVHQPFAILQSLWNALVFPWQTPEAGLIWMLVPFLMCTFWLAVSRAPGMFERSEVLD